MTQRLIVDVTLCTECRACELVCSFVHFGVFNGNKSGVRIVSKWPELPRARLCIQCEEPACVSACPVEALVCTDAGVVKVRYEECNGCGACVEDCPFDGIWLDPLSDMAIKCDTCEGRFECVPYCFTGALSIGGEDGDGQGV
ncbi:MAG TPA: 4Fe-4S dicluster domain-containing protein [Anaerolineae bacterium]|nr:4Fe-4S dicluster domain-containing protein [Anaerolineae bacterium]